MILPTTAWPVTTWTVCSFILAWHPLYLSSYISTVSNNQVTLTVSKSVSLSPIHLSSWFLFLINLSPFLVNLTFFSTKIGETEFFSGSTWIYSRFLLPNSSTHIFLFLFIFFWYIFRNDFECDNVDCGVYLGVNLANLVSTLTLKALSIDDQYGFLFLSFFFLGLYAWSVFYLYIDNCKTFGDFFWEFFRLDHCNNSLKFVKILYI